MTVKDKNLNSFERRLEILFFIIKRRKTNLYELVNMFSICRATAAKDIVFLSRYAPICTKPGRYGGIFLVGDYRNEVFLYLSKEEEMFLQGLLKVSQKSDAHILQNILNKYSMPTS